MWNADLRSLRITFVDVGLGSGKSLWIPIYWRCPTYGCRGYGIRSMPTTFNTLKMRITGYDTTNIGLTQLNGQSPRLYRGSKQLVVRRFIAVGHRFQRPMNRATTI